MARERGFRVIAEFSIHPIGEGTSVSSYVRAALSELEKARGLRLQVTPMATVIEAEKLSDILRAVGAAHESLFHMGAKRVDFILRVDDRRDKKRRMEDKVSEVA
ncbi:MAG TPA: MTH1187 family thiamine-binding protein [Nitrososphaerales archaeon]|nr:MTH1187 family thiamine-binding protein [Nitrososphaerales archaeon]